MNTILMQFVRSYAVVGTLDEADMDHAYENLYWKIMVAATLAEPYPLMLLLSSHFWVSMDEIDQMHTNVLQMASRDRESWSFGDDAVVKNRGGASVPNNLLFAPLNELQPPGPYQLAPIPPEPMPHAQPAAVTLVNVIPPVAAEAMPSAA
ncbi:hypothetical protein HDU97_009047, partial [Phlyctochytrium planicorne]